MANLFLESPIGLKNIEILLIVLFILLMICMLIAVSHKDEKKSTKKK